MGEGWRGMEGISGSWQERENSQLSPVGPYSQEPTSSALGDLVESERLRLKCVMLTLRTVIFDVLLVLSLGHLSGPVSYIMCLFFLGGRHSPLPVAGAL